MNRIKYALFAIISFSLVVGGVGAASCSYEEQAKLNSEVANIKTNFEIKQRKLDKGEYDIPDVIIGTPEADNYEMTISYFQVNILNLTENVYIEVTNNVDGTKNTYRYSDAKDGNISFTRDETDKLITYTVKVYASANTGCEESLLKTLYISLPRYNSFSTYPICKEMPEHDMCQSYVNFEEMSFKDFETEMKEETEKLIKEEEKKNEHDAKWYVQVLNFVKEHKVAFIIGGAGVLVASGTVAFVIIKRRRRSII